MKNRTVRCRLVFLLLAGLFVILAALSFSVGSVSLSLRDMCEILSGADRESTAFHILWDIRLPRLFAAALLGGALSVSGFLLQTFFANPIAGPFVLGISSGAKLVVALVMILFLGKGLFMGSAAMILAAFAGSYPVSSTCADCAACESTFESFSGTRISIPSARRSVSPSIHFLNFSHRLFS